MESKAIKLDNEKHEFDIPLSTFKKYYLEYYPSELVIDWLCRKDINNLKYREISFKLPNLKVIRYQSFKSVNEFKKRIYELNPLKIDIGAIYNQEPRIYAQHKSETELICLEKELIFDIDISDYDDVRKCCQKNDICSKCWKYIICGSKILERILREDFGFKQIFFVFSGRRGVHCWVSDKRACLLNKKGRLAIERYINYDRMDEKNYDSKIYKLKRNFINPVYPAYLSAVSIMKNYFFEIVKEQDILKDEKMKTNLKNIISMYFSLIDMNYINEILEKNMNSLNKIKKIFEFLQKGESILKKKNQIHYFYAESCINEFMMIILYPRLDGNVTRQFSHLLKGPFCVHPETGYISVPLSIELMEKFSLDKIPKVDYLLYDEIINEDKKSFEQYIKFFKNFVDNLNEENNKK
jgi:DNA primase small subunit